MIAFKWMQNPKECVALNLAVPCLTKLLHRRRPSTRKRGGVASCRDHANGGTSVTLYFADGSLNGASLDCAEAR